MVVCVPATGAACSPGDIAWVLAATALVMFMTPGLGFFYGGLVRRKNLVSTIVQCMAIFAVVSLAWALWGYTMAFGPSVLDGFIGNFQFFALNGVGTAANTAYSSSIPALLYFAFQLKFAAITPALIIGAFAGRIRLKPLLIFILAWVTFIYFPVAHWIWKGKPSSVGMCVGFVCGLAAVTPAAGYVGPDLSLVIGVVAGVACNFVVRWRARTKLDDSLDVFACHGVGGMWGTVATGLFASAAISGQNGLVYGNPHFALLQMFAVAVVASFAFFGTYVILHIINFFSPLRASPEEQTAGLDEVHFGEEAYYPTSE